MDNTIFQTPSGHKVTIKPFMTYPEKRRVQRVFFSAASVNPGTGENAFDMGVQIDAQDTILKIMVRRIELKDGRVIEGNEQAVFEGLSEFADADITALYDKLDELTKTLSIFPKSDRGEKGSA